MASISRLTKARGKLRLPRQVRSTLLSSVQYSPMAARCGFRLEMNEPTETLIYPPQTVQNKCLRTITGAYNTTNVQRWNTRRVLHP